MVNNLNFAKIDYDFTNPDGGLDASAFGGETYATTSSNRIIDDATTSADLNFTKVEIGYFTNSDGGLDASAFAEAPTSTAPSNDYFLI